LTISAAQRGKIDQARMRRRHQTELRLLDDLGWAPTDDRETFQITMKRWPLERLLGQLAAVRLARVAETCQPSDADLDRAQELAAARDTDYDVMLHSLSRNRRRPS
jgi:hypothetical protein